MQTNEKLSQHHMRSVNRVQIGSAQTQALHAICSTRAPQPLPCPPFNVRPSRASSSYEHGSHSTYLPVCFPVLSPTSPTPPPSRLTYKLTYVRFYCLASAQSSPFLVKLLQPGEEVETLLKLPPEKILMRWVNYHLEQVHIACLTQRSGEGTVGARDLGQSHSAVARSRTRP
eukprot:6201459-Pleurochrysis_carterae.AAC.2